MNSGETHDPELDADEAGIDEDEIDRAEIDEIKQHAADPSAPRSVLHYFSAPTQQKAELCAAALGAKYEAQGADTTWYATQIDLTDPEYDPVHAFEVVFEHEAIVNEEYLETIRDIEATGEAAGAEYGGWQAEEG